MMAGTAKTNWVAIWISAAVVVLLVAVGGLVVWMNNQATAPGEAPQASYIDPDTGAIAIGDGEDIIDEYLDFMCPICGDYYATYGETVHGLVDDGSITLNVHPISILNRASQGTEYSTRAASAMYCVAEESQDAAVEFLDLLFVNQPEEGTRGLTDGQLSDFATQAGADGASSCIAEGTYSKYVDSITQKTPIQEGADSIATPTVVLNDEILRLSGDPQADIASQLQH